MDAFVAGAWRQAARGEVYAGGQWRRLTRAEAYIGGQWRTVLSFAPPMTLSAPSEVSGFRNSQKPTSGVVSAVASCTPNGGASPYTYVWQVIEGGFTLSTPTSASTGISRTLPANSDITGLVRVTCTDSLGNIASADVSVYLSNQSDF